ncbi:hypothetical protein HSBAA_12800 [Vreelandella sulfidaeris]|uniref:Uncharacterized protein n=1 Tax=Vreelandella sulfidaeris TaxID=115553 RepID=A0A455U9H4_9GAMM|nr:hypothetical protein HSBAA_12800 [Halomonas sulfidaeris]
MRSGIPIQTLTCQPAPPVATLTRRLKGSVANDPANKVTAVSCKGGVALANSAKSGAALQKHDGHQCRTNTVPTWK